MNTKVKKTEDKQKYMREYMKQRYENDKVKSRMYRNTNRLKCNYPNIDKNISDTYKYATAHIMKILQLYSELPTEFREKFTQDFQQFQNIRKEEYLGVLGKI